MNGQIAGLITSTIATDKAQVQNVFGPKFQSMADWRSFVRTKLNTNVSSQLAASSHR